MEDWAGLPDPFGGDNAEDTPFEPPDDRPRPPEGHPPITAENGGGTCPFAAIQAVLNERANMSSPSALPPGLRDFTSKTSVSPGLRDFASETSVAQTGSARLRTPVPKPKSGSQMTQELLAQNALPPLENIGSIGENTGERVGSKLEKIGSARHVKDDNASVSHSRMSSSASKSKMSRRTRRTAASGSCSCMF